MSAISPPTKDTGLNLKGLILEADCTEGQGHLDVCFSAWFWRLQIDPIGIDVTFFFPPNLLICLYIAPVLPSRWLGGAGTSSKTIELLREVYSSSIEGGLCLDQAGTR